MTYLLKIGVASLFLPTTLAKREALSFCLRHSGVFLERLLERHGTGDRLALLSVWSKWIGPLLPGLLPDRIRWWIGKLHVLGNIRDRKCGG
jgi:hypothetical protein